MRFGHRRKQVLGDGVHPSFTAPLDLDTPIVEALTDGLDPFRLEQEMVVHKVNRTVPQFLEMLELLHDVLRAPRAPLAFVEDGNVAENAGPGTAA